MPSMTELSSTIVLAETGVNMNIFDDAKHFCSWCGLSPTNNESASKKKSIRIAQANNYLKPIMVQCALAAIKSKKQPYFAVKYRQIKKRRGHKEELMNPQNHVERVVLNETSALAFLAAQGYDISCLVKCNDN